MNHRIHLKTEGQGLYEFTRQVQQKISMSNLNEGLCTVFVRHTSCSVVIQENADPTAKADLEAWLNRLVPENDPLYTHLAEGLDDMPAHIKSVLTSSQVSIPFENNQLLLGTWQGIFLWEHRHQSQSREVVVSCC